MNIIPFEVRHITEISLQPRQVRTISYSTLHYVAALKAAGPSASAEVDGQIIASAGIALIGFGIGALWVYAGEKLIPHAIGLDRALRRLIEIPQLRRLEATTEADWMEACRWLEHLGFVSEGILRKYGEDGSDHIRYART